MVFRMANLKLMTEEEREAYFNRPESLKVQFFFAMEMNTAR